MADQKKVKWGVVGAASIATRKVIPGMQKGALSEITALASRDLNKAKAAAKNWELQKPMARTKSCWRTRRSKRFTTRCQIICTCRGRRRLPTQGSKPCAQSRFR